MQNMVEPYSYFSDDDLYLFSSGKHHKLYDKFGCHHLEIDGRSGLYFAVYAPGAQSVRVIGDFNYWQGQGYELHVRWDSSGIWEGFVPGLEYGQLYKYQILSHHQNTIVEKSDPFAFCGEMPPRTASISWSQDYIWKDSAWMHRRAKTNPLEEPCSIYEMHLGSWRKKTDGNSLSYREMAEELPAYIKEMGFTHVEFLPLMEHPYYPSWGYQITSYFAPTRRYGDPEDLKYLIDVLHQHEIGVIMDWVPSHFAVDEHGLRNFDGSKVYEHPDPRKGYHMDWKSFIFNYERPEIVSFLLSSAHFWLDYFHVDGLRVDAVASMLYLDYSREHGQWEPNEYGGNENMAAIAFLKELNSSLFKKYPGILMTAEESTAFSGVTRPVHLGGLGFNTKWMMGWMNDTLRYIKRDPVYRSYHHREISFSMVYANTENFVLPLSHDEVVHGKASLVAKMPGDEWQKFANLRLLYAYQFTHPGHKLLFMGCEFGQMSEWQVNGQLEWWVRQYSYHEGVSILVSKLNELYTSHEALYKLDFWPEGFQWISHDDHEQCILAYCRQTEDKRVYVVLNFTPTPRHGYRIGVHESKNYKVLLNTDQEHFGGSGMNTSVEIIDQEPMHGMPHCVELDLPPLGALFFE